MIDFPASPTVGQVFTPANGVTYQWNGTVWLAAGMAAPGGDFTAVYVGADYQMNPAVVVKFNTVVVGNAGLWFNTSNNRYTPPAGRYHLYAAISAYSSVASSNGLTFRKNSVSLGAPINSTSPANATGQTVVETIVDANGTDFFDVVADSASAGVFIRYGYFGAFPISGIKGPPGDQLNGFRLLQRTVVSSAVPQIDYVNAPSDINELMFFGSNLVPSVNDASPALRFFDGVGAIDTGNNYSTGMASPHSGMGVAGAVVGSGFASLAGIFFSHGNATNNASNIASLGGVTLEGKVPGIRLASGRKHMAFQSQYTNAGNTIAFGISGGGQWVNATGLITGLRFFFNVGNIASGTFSVWGSP